MRVSRSFCVLSLLLATACAVGVGLDPDFERFDAGPDASRRQTGGRAGSAGASQAGSSATSGQGGSAAGRAGTGGSGTGGSTAGASAMDASETGGARGDGAPPDVVAVDTSSGCVSGQKVCGGRCVVPEARVGCDLVGCDPCPSPAHAIAICTGTSCDFACTSGYVRSGPACIPMDGGAGAGGTGGATDDAGPMHCVASQCSGCIPVIQAPCCKPDDTCGCQYPFFPCN